MSVGIPSARETTAKAKPSIMTRSLLFCPETPVLMGAACQNPAATYVIAITLWAIHNAFRASKKAPRAMPGPKTGRRPQPAARCRPHVTRAGYSSRNALPIQMRADGPAQNGRGFFPWRARSTRRSRDAQRVCRSTTHRTASGHCRYGGETPETGIRLEPLLSEFQGIDTRGGRGMLLAARTRRSRSG
jgi:hypothetical protein